MPLDAKLDALAATAWTLDPPAPYETKDLCRDEAALLLDGLLVRLARGRGAVDVAIGEGLAALGTGDRVLRLGHSCLGDYARERLGITASTAEKMARLARELRDRPVLREAVRTGEVSARKAETVLPAARGDAEAAWVARARTETVRALEAAVKEEEGREPERDEPWERVVCPLGAEARARLDEAMELAGKLLGAGAPKWQRLEAICAEYLGAHPDGSPDDGGVGPERIQLDNWMEETKAWFEHETRQWEFLEQVEPFAAPGDAVEDARTDPFRLDEDLRRFARMRDGWDLVFGHVAMLLRCCGIWRHMKFVSFGHYCSERLGMAERTVAQRASLARRLYELPALRQAMRDGRISYEKARLVAGCATGETIEDWISRAERMPCIALAREIDAASEAQMCAREEMDVRVPVRVGALLHAAFRAARTASGRPLSRSECIEAIARHFVDTWKPLVVTRNTVQKRVLARDRGFCQVPGCSRAAVHAHHVLFRSLGGGDEPENLVSLCAAHHLHGVHMGWIRVRGRAPDELRWQLGAGAGVVPIAQA